MTTATLGQVILPVFVEKATGDDMAPQLEKEYGGISPNRRLQEYINSVGNRLLPFSKRKDFPHKFIVLEDDKIVNAFALGNGNTYVTRGLLKMLDDEAELAEVMGHEIAHVANRHIGKQIEKALGMGVLLALAEAFYTQAKGGRVSEGSQKLIDAANGLIPALVLNGFGRSQELESDEDGLKYMVSAGYDPMGGVRVFEKFQKLAPEAKGIEVYLQSHPTATQRISDLKARIERKYPGVKGETFRDRYQSIVGSMDDGAKPGAATAVSDGLSTLETVGIVAGVGVLVGGMALVIASVA